MPAPHRGVQISDSVRKAFQKQLATSRTLFLVFTVLFAVFGVAEALNFIDVLNIKHKSPEFGAIMDAILFSASLISLLMAFGKYGRIKCPGCLKGMWTTDNPQYCPKCYQPFKESAHTPGPAPTQQL